MLLVGRGPPLPPLGAHHMLYYTSDKRLFHFILDVKVNTLMQIFHAGGNIFNHYCTSFALSIDLFNQYSQITAKFMQRNAFYGLICENAEFGFLRNSFGFDMKINDCLFILS